MADPLCIHGRAIVSGSASGRILHADVGLSFWGGVNPTTGDVVDQHHPLCGTTLVGNVLAIPKGRGSCTGSQVLLELILGESSPAAILLGEPDEIIALGVIVAEELFGRSMPVVVLGASGFAQVSEAVQSGLCYANVHGTSVTFCSSASSFAQTELPPTPELAELALSETDRTMLSGASGRAVQAAMRIIVRMAGLQGAQELIDVSQVHIDGCTYIGPASLKVAKQFVDWGGVVRVPTTLNSISVEKEKWRMQGVPEALGKPASDLADTYVALGAKPSFTCAPYLLDSAPSKGEQIGWGESNAVVFANSVLGARTEKYADYLDACVALTARAPKIGCHVDSGRFARVVLVLPSLDSLQIDDAFYPTLGYLCGLKASTRIPAIVGLQNQAPTRDNLKAFSAAFGTSSSVPMFHIIGVTPEAPDLASALGSPDADVDCTNTTEVIHLNMQDIEDSWRELDSGDGGTVDLVALGNPHFSVDEYKHLADLCRSRRKHPDVRMVVTSGPEVLAIAHAAGHISELESFGAQAISDTCWCMLGEVVPAPESVMPTSVRTLMTNSAKYAHYAPGLVGRKVRFGSLAACVDAACKRSADKMLPGWLLRGQGVRSIATTAVGWQPRQGLRTLARSARSCMRHF